MRVRKSHPTPTVQETFVEPSSSYPPPATGISDPQDAPTTIQGCAIDTFGELSGHQQHLTTATALTRVSLATFPPKGDHERLSRRPASRPKPGQPARPRGKTRLTDPNSATRVAPIAAMRRGSRVWTMHDQPHLIPRRPKPAKNGFSDAGSVCKVSSARAAQAFCGATP